MEKVKEVSCGFCILQLKQGDIRFVEGDKKFAEITGYEPEEILAEDFSIKQIIPEKARKDFVYTICKQLKERRLACVEVEFLRKDFQSIHVMCCLNYCQSAVHGENCVQAIIQDVTQEKIQNQQLQNQIEQDAMTQLYNKGTIEKVVNGILDVCKASEVCHAFFLIDIDNFKYINDTFGHVFGDTVIQDLAAAIVKAFPKKAKSGRIGGDEFVVFLPDTNEEMARKAAEKVAGKMRREIMSEVGLVQISCSIGVTMWQPTESYQELVRKADAAMYYAKDSGKNQSAFFQDFMEKEFKNKKTRHDQIQRGRNMEQTYDVEFVFFAYQLLTDSKQVDSSMNLLLERAVERYGLDWVSVFERQKQKDMLQRTNSVTSANADRMGETECRLEKQWLQEYVNAQGEMIVHKVIPGENFPFSSNYITVPKSFVLCTFKEEEEIYGCVVFAQYQQQRSWNPYEIKTFHELTKAIALFSFLRRDKRSNMEKIRELATRDKVTGLLDQKNFEIRLEDYIRHCRDFSCLALVYVDINNFSYVNERYGLQAGDDVLSSFARLLSNSKETLLAGRIFSDCFLGLHANESREKAIHKITEGHEIMSMALRKKYPVASLQFKCGIYFLEDENCTVQEAIENANMARKSIKEDTRTNYGVYSKEIREKRVQEQEVVVEFLECIKNDTLELYLQPSFQIKSKELKCVEAFCRWHNYYGVQRKPGEIIPVLKRNGYILEWDMAVYEKVLRQMQSWKEMGAEVPVVEVNFSTVDFQYTRIVKDIVGLAEKYQVNPSNIVIEISEHGLRKATQKVSYVLKELHKCGFKIAIDNFGSNYSPLEMLVDESVDLIKTGKNLLYMGKEKQLRSDYLRYIRGVVESVSKEIIFVGAENQQQVDEIKECGYDVVQGYLYQCELPAESFEAQYIRIKE